MLKLPSDAEVVVRLVPFTLMVAPANGLPEAASVIWPVIVWSGGLIKCFGEVSLPDAAKLEAVNSNASRNLNFLCRSFFIIELVFVSKYEFLQLAGKHIVENWLNAGLNIDNILIT